MNEKMSKKPKKYNANSFSNYKKHLQISCKYAKIKNIIIKYKKFRGMYG